MPVSIQDVLSLLPEMLPGVQAIPLKRIRPNPENPGPPVSEEDIQGMAESILADGLLDPAKLRPYSGDPLAPGVALHPDNPRLKADGTPWRGEDFNWMILTGEFRWRALVRLESQGWVWQGPPSPDLQPSYRLTHFDTPQEGAMPTFALNPTEEESVVITHTDNDPREKGWFAAYQSIEQLVRANPSLTVRQVATRLKMDPTRVSKALRLLPLLNPAARGLIVGNSYNSNKGIWGISEAAALRLADLGPGGSLKPGVKAAGSESQKLWPYPPMPPETQDLVRRALAVAIDQELTEAGVKALVSWVQDGHQPEDYGSKSQGKDKPVIGKGKFPKPEHKQIPVDRIRINLYWSFLPFEPGEIERKALSMKSTRFVKEIMVRTLLDEERVDDPDHDFEVFEGVDTFEGAKFLGLPMLQAIVYSGMDQWDAIGLINELSRVTRCSTWIDFHKTIEKLIEINPKNTVTNAALDLGEDPAFANKVFPVMALLNKSARNAIAQSIHKCHEGLTDIGGYRFVAHFAPLLEPLKGVSKDLSKTQKLVEMVVGVAIEKELYRDEIKALVDWVLAGHDPDQFKAEAAVE